MDIDFPSSTLFLHSASKFIYHIFLATQLYKKWAGRVVTTIVKK